MLTEEERYRLFLGERDDLLKRIDLSCVELDEGIMIGDDEAAELLRLIVRHHDQSQQFDDPSTTSFAQVFYARVLRRLSPDSGQRSSFLYNLANAFSVDFDQRGHPLLLDNAIARHREALELRSTPSRGRSNSLHNLASVLLLLKRFHQTHQLVDLDEAIALHRNALSLRIAPKHHRSSSLNNLASALSIRFDHTGQLTDLKEAVALHREALTLRPIPHPNRPESLQNLANVLVEQFSQTGQPAGEIGQLHEAIALHLEALELQPTLHPGRSMLFNDLASALTMRFGQTGQRADLDGAIALHRGALTIQPTSHPDRWISLNNLGSALATRFSKTGEHVDLDEAIALHRQALGPHPAPHPDRWTSINNLASALATEFGETGQLAELQESVALYREALSLRPAPHPDRSMSLHYLANILLEQFGQTGQLADLDEAVALHREALGLRPVSHPSRSNSLNSLASALSTRFHQMRQLADIDEAVALDREALDLRAASHPQRSNLLSNLAGVLAQRSGQTGRLVDLDEAIVLLREALELRTAPHPDRPRSLSALASALSTRCSQTNQRTDLDEAITLHREALNLWPEDHADRSSLLNNLANGLGMRFRQTGQISDLEEAMGACSDSLFSLPQEHPGNCTASANLGATLMDMYLQSQQREDLDSAMDAFRAAVGCESAPTSERLRAARRWAQNADASHGSALEAYQIAIGLLPRLAMLGLDLQSRQQVLASGTDGLVRNAAACAIRSGQFSKAVELLEGGRAIFWSQALQLRTPLDDLKSEPGAEDLAQRLEALARALEQGSLRDVSRAMSDAPQKVLSMEKEAIHYRHLNDEWFATLDEIRRLDGYHDFLLPKGIYTLRKAAANGPVVILNASKSGCAALIMTSDDVKHVPLPAFTYNTGEVLIAKIRRLPNASYREERFSMRVGAASSDDIFRSVLKTLWKSVVEPVVRSLNLQKSESPPRLWWCPTGPFAFLPIHAAGIYDAVGDESVSDYVVSSYTPTLSALLAPSPAMARPFNVMVVIQPDIPDHPKLPNTRTELSKIQGHVPEECLTQLGIPTAPASLEQVLLHLSAASIVHFACHGVQGRDSPLDSAIILEDGPLRVSSIMEQPMANASLAFLSACQTAMGDANLPDEVIHLAATLLFAGFRSTVATMWSIQDVDGPKIADSFYGYLFREKISADGDASCVFPDTTEAARALQLAVAKLRSEKCSFVRWVPFVHFGL